MRSGTIAFLLGACILHALEALPGLWAAALLPVALHVAAARRRAAAGWCAIGFLWALLHAHATIAARVPVPLVGEDIVLTGRIASIPTIAPHRTRFDFAVETGLPIRTGRLRLSWYANPRGDLPELVTGETWRLVVRLRAPRGFRNPGGFDYETWLFRHGYSGQGYVRGHDPRNRKMGAAGAFDPGRIRYALSRRLHELPGIGPAGALIEALVVGVRDRIDDDQRETLRQTGTAHLLAISGLHIGLAAGLGFLAGRIAGPWLVPGVAPLRLGAIAGIAVAAGYAALAGFSLPTRRALVMAIVVLGALCSRRRLSGGSVLCLGLMAVLILEPPAVLAPGFWLSFCAVAVLLHGMGGRPHAERSILHWHRWGLPQIVVAVGLAPLVLRWFAEQPLAGPVANAIAIPMVGIAVLPALLAGSLCLSLPGPFAGSAGELLVTTGARGLEVLWGLLELLAAHGPQYTLSVEPSIAATALAMVGAMILLAPPGLPGRWTGALWFAPLLWWTPTVPAPGEVRAAFLDVGHGLAVVVETRDRSLVYDTGAAHAADIVESYLAWRGRRSIDTIVISHADADHAGGYPDLARRWPAREVLANEGIAGAAPCVSGRAWTWNGVGFEVLHPPPSPSWQGNDGSCVLRVSAAGRTLLLAGDIESRAERWLLQRRPDLRADLISAPHHGSRTSSGPAFLDAVSARHVVFSVRHENAWNLPHPTVVERYRARGAAVHRTDAHGAVIASIRSSGAIEIRHWRPGRFWHAR